MRPSRDSRQLPLVIGVPGGGLRNAGWAANRDVAAVGRRGEERTAEILDALAVPGGPTVLHDLNIPIPGFSANIDHVVVSKRQVLLIDSKVWKPGFYWTLAGTTRRGLVRFPYADKKTMGMAVDAVGRFLRVRGVKADLLRPVIAVWSSRRHSEPDLFFLRPPVAKVIHAGDLGKYTTRHAGRKPADPQVVSALANLVNSV